MHNHLEFVKALRQHHAAPNYDMRKLRRNIVFSDLIFNTDDHPRNALCALLADQHGKC